MRLIVLFISLLFTSLFNTNKAEARLKLRDCQFNGTQARCAKNVSYGSDPLHKLDVWVPVGASDVPIVVYIHGGGYFQGDKSSAYTYGPVQPDLILKMGMAFATINYRLSGDNPYRKGVTGQYPAAMADSAQAIQFLRHNSAGLSINKSKLALTGNSAGGGISLWLTLHDDLANPAARNFRRQSSRTECVMLFDTQPTLNIPEVLDLIAPDGWQLDSGLPGLYGLTPEQYLSAPRYYDRILAESYEEASPMSHLSSDDHPSILLSYSLGFGEGNIHSPELGVYFAAGQPQQIQQKYMRQSLEGLGIGYRLLVEESKRTTQSAIKSFLNNQCF